MRGYKSILLLLFLAVNAFALTPNENITNITKAVGAVIVKTPYGTNRFKGFGATPAARGAALSNAYSVAVSGDEIVVGPGHYAPEMSFGKNGVNWDLTTAIVSNTSVAVFACTNLVFSISGQARLYSWSQQAVLLVNTSVVSIVCQSLYGSVDGVTVQAGIEINTGSRANVIVSDFIRSGGYDGILMGAAISGSGGGLSIWCPYVRGGDNSIEMAGGFLRGWIGKTESPNGIVAVTSNSEDILSLFIGDMTADSLYTDTAQYVGQIQVTTYSDGLHYLGDIGTALGVQNRRSDGRTVTNISASSIVQPFITLGVSSNGTFNLANTAGKVRAGGYDLAPASFGSIYFGNTSGDSFGFLGNGANTYIGANGSMFFMNANNSVQMAAATSAQWLFSLPVFISGNSTSATHTATSLVAGGGGIASATTNATLTMAAGGITNTTTIQYTIYGFTGTGVVLTNLSRPINITLGTITAPATIVLQPNDALMGTLCSAAGDRGF